MFRFFWFRGRLRSRGSLRCRWRRQLLQCVARTEAVIDFGEDEEIGDEVLTTVTAHVDQLRWRIDAYLRDRGSGEITREVPQMHAETHQHRGGD